MELQKSMRRQANTLNHRLWGMKVHTPLTNRLADGIALASWGAEAGRVGRRDAILLNGCYPLDSGSFYKFKITDGILEEHGRPPETMYMFIKKAIQRPRLFSAMYGDEYKEDMLRSIGRLRDIHEDWPEFPTESLIAETWGRMTYQFNICVDEGIRYIVGRYDEGVTRDKIKRCALTPWIGGYDSSPRCSISTSRTVFGRRLRYQISNKIAKGKTSETPISARPKGIGRPIWGKRGKKLCEERNGGYDDGNSKIPFPWRSDKPKSAYPTAHTPDAMRKKIGYTHRPLNRDVGAHRYGFITHSGCASRKATCTFSNMSRTRPGGLHWTAPYEISSRGDRFPQKDSGQIGRRLSPVDERDEFTGNRTAH